MKQIQYRLNRAEGKIFAYNQGQLTEIGDSLKTIILHATESMYGDPFEQNRSQDWIQLCFLDPDLNWCHTLLNSGNSGALSAWIGYQHQLKKQGKNLWDVTTTISFSARINSYTGYSWYYYNFEQSPLPDNINLTKILKVNRHLHLVDPSINLNFPNLNKHPLLSSNTVDERAKFVCW
jgi:hypothetical protein